MKLLVIGTIIRDIIHSIDGTISLSPGGLCHTINSLLSLIDEEDTIVPVSFVGRDFYDEIIHRYKGNKQIVTDGLIPCDQPNNTVELKYQNPVERQERSLNPFPELPFSAIERFLDADAVMINMISGWEFELSVLQKIRKCYPGLISIDLHSLTMGRREDGLRFLRPVPNIEDWIECADIIQVNEREFESIGGDLKRPEIFLERSCFKERNIFNLTKGREGSTTFNCGSGKLAQYSASPVKNLNIVDPTGCGDVFLAGFLISFIKAESLQNAADEANRIAALSGTFYGIPDPDRLAAKLRKDV